MPTNLPANSGPRVAVSVSSAVPPSVLKKLKKSGVSWIEFRADRLASPTPKNVLSVLRRLKGLSVLLTIRSKKEGGSWKGSEAERLVLYLKALPHVSAVDVELSSQVILKPVLHAARKAGKTSVVSTHNFNRMFNPPELKKILSRSKAAGADVVKVAAMAKTDWDVFTLADFTFNNRKKGVITIAMGDKGSISRVIFPALGSALTFASLGKPGAPGQMDWKTTLVALSAFYPKYRLRAGRA